MSLYIDDVPDMWDYEKYNEDDPEVINNITELSKEIGAVIEHLSKIEKLIEGIN